MLADLAYRHAISPSGNLLPRVRLHVAQTPSWPVPTLYRPMLGMVLRGAKRVIIGDRELCYGPGQYFIGSIDVPAASAVIGVPVAMEPKMHLSEAISASC